MKCVFAVFVTYIWPVAKSYEEEDTCVSYEEEDTCVSYEEEDTCVSYEEEDTSVSYEEEDTCVSYEEEDTCDLPLDWSAGHLTCVCVSWYV